MPQALGQLFSPLAPLHTLWWLVFGVTIGHALEFLYTFFKGIPGVTAVAYGLAIILVTVAIRLILAPLFHFQLSSARKNMEAQRRLQPEIAKLRKKYKKDPQKLNTETMALYREHGVNPLSSLAGCLPAVLQMPVLIALYWVLYQHTGLTINYNSSAFLWTHLIWSGKNKPHDIPLALLAGALTWVQTRMAMPPPPPPGAEPDPQQQVSQSMQFISPVMIMFFGYQFPPGLPLYWATSTAFGIVQQYLVSGWGSLPVLGSGGSARS